MIFDDIIEGGVRLTDGDLLFESQMKMGKGSFIKFKAQLDPNLCYFRSVII